MKQLYRAGWACSPGHRPHDLGLWHVLATSCQGRRGEGRMRGICLAMFYVGNPRGGSDLVMDVRLMSALLEASCCQFGLSG